MSTAITINGRRVLALAKDLQEAAPKTFVPPSEGTLASSESVLPTALVKDTRGYIEKVANQVNGCYEKGWYDGCAVMMRRMVETLIIECFEEYKISGKIKNTEGDYLYLRDLIDATLKEDSWTLGRNAKKSLSRLKDIGDKSAHSRRFNAFRDDVDRVRDDFRDVCQELLYLANLK
jgi:hypothetical protein